jgi:hypothetical protein
LPLNFVLAPCKELLPNMEFTGPEKIAEERATETYAGGEHLAFDPLADLNLPESYEEVVARFRRIQGSRAWEQLN